MQISEFDEAVEQHRTAWTIGVAMAWVDAGFARLLRALDDMRDAFDELSDTLANEEDISDNDGAK